MPIALSVNQRYPWVLPDERANAEDDTVPKEGGTVFYIKTVPGYEVGEMNAASSNLIVPAEKNEDDNARARAKLKIVEPEPTTNGNVDPAEVETSFTVNWAATKHACMTVCRLGLDGWDNFLDADGNVVEATRRKDGALDDASLGRIPQSALLQLTLAIISKNSVSASDAGN